LPPEPHPKTFKRQILKNGFGVNSQRFYQPCPFRPYYTGWVIQKLSTNLETFNRFILTIQKADLFMLYRMLLLQRHCAKGFSSYF
jgi:hypothetical protein